MKRRGDWEVDNDKTAEDADKSDCGGVMCRVWKRTACIRANPVPKLPGQTACGYKNAERAKEDARRMCVLQFPCRAGSGAVPGVRGQEPCQSTQVLYREEEYMKWRVLIEGDNGAGITLTAWVTVLADDAETLYSEADKAARSLEKEWGIPCRLVRTEVADIE